MHEQETKQCQESPSPKQCRLDRKDGRRLVKDTTAVDCSASTDPNTTLELIREPRPIIRLSRNVGKAYSRLKGKS